MKKAILGFCSLLFLVSCGPQQKEPHLESLSPEQAFIQSIEQAHQIDKYDAKEVIQFDLNLIFGGKKRFEGTIQMTPSGGLVKMIDSNRTLIWDGNEAYTSDTSYSGGRFSLLTWSYFFAAPYKLRDPGSNMELLGSKNLNELVFDAGRLTFENGVGDSPDDWYIAYKEKESDLLVAMAYIVTASTSIEEAEQDPHAITYEAFVEVDMIPFATQWNFWTWNEAGELNKLLGSATLSNIQFVKMDDTIFKIPV